MIQVGIKIKVDDFHHRSITVYPNRETFEKMKEDLLVYREEMKNSGIELVGMEEGPFLGRIQSSVFFNSK